MTYWQAGERAYKVMVYGGDDMDPSREIEPGDEHRTKRAAIAEAKAILAAKANEQHGLWWSADVEPGTWIDTSWGVLDWEPDDTIPSFVARFVLLEDGRVVPE